MTPDKFKSVMALKVELRKAKEKVLKEAGYKKPTRNAVDWSSFQADEDAAIDFFEENEFEGYLVDGFNILVEEKPVYAYKVIRGHGDGVQTVERQQIGTTKRLRVHSK